MKILILLSLFSSAAFAQTSQTFSGEEIVINGLRVSARKHWNFARTATADYHFCKFQGYEGAIRKLTVTKKVEAQVMVFFTAELITENPSNIAIRENETSMLDQVTCSR
jgi:hypothetical protein